ncbi:hypothetical protein CEV32_0043 [Brucella rhizosphaerae]|uniref:Uncharacterized protein n=1 Tax=Brucella rhizosphaerae TaxID=571254 RepID=A0A256FHY1_9HYPH|nr:hypothetical protein CEV32_0043 [Brucella rhizosphaerae]
MRPSIHKIYSIKLIKASMIVKSDFDICTPLLQASNKCRNQNDHWQAYEAAGFFEFEV